MSVDLELALQPDSSRLTLAHFLEDIEQRHGRSVALRFEGSDVRYAELAVEARLLARGLIAVGVCKGAHVAVLMANRPEWVTAAFAVALVGAVLVPVNTFATSEERDYILRHSDASLLLLQRDLMNHTYLEDLLRDHPELADGTPGPVYCKALPQLRGAFCLGLAERRGGVEPWAALAERADSVPAELVRELADEISPSDDAILIYTSGTTAHPKGVLHRQRAAVIQSYRFAEYMGLAADDCIYSAQPFFWTAGIAMSLGATLAAGARLVLQESFEPGAALDAIESEGVTAIFCWPHQDKALAEHPSISDRDLSRARKVEFRSPLAALVGLEVDEWSTYASYGLSETFTLACAYPASTPAAVRSGTHGRPLPGMQVRIVDPQTGEPVGPDTPGEIAVKGATLMAGYYKVDSELYLDVDGFFRTQDGGSLDKDGVLHWTGRLSNLIKTGGANVSPLEIEDVLSQFSGLKAGLAVGIPHPTLGEAIVLCAVLTHDGAIEAEAVRAFLREKLAAYKVPRVVLLFGDDELSYTGNQKIQADPLRELALARAERDGIEIEGFVYSEGGQT